MSELEGVEDPAPRTQGQQGQAQGQEQGRDRNRETNRAGRDSQNTSEYTDDNDGEGHDAERSADEESDGAFVPIKTSATAEGGQRRRQRRRSSASRSLERSWSLNDGYSPHPQPGYDVDATGETGSVAGEKAPEGVEGVNYVVGWEEGDAMNPRNFGTPRRWAIVLICSMGSLCVTCTSSIYTLTYGQITEQFECSQLVATLGLSFFIFGLGVGPLFLAPLSEFYGRRYIYIASFALFLIWLVPCAVAQNIETMIVCRFFNGLSGSAFLSVAGGTVGDLFARHELAAPMVIYTSSPFIGPSVGPLIGGFINQFSTWRWTFYVLIIWAGVQLASLILFVPETYHPVLLRRKAQKLRRETGDERWQAPIEKLERSVVQTVVRSCYRPVLLLALEPMCLCLCLFSALLLGILYLFFGAFQLVFGNVYGFSLWQRGCSFLGLLVGIAFAIMMDPIWRRLYERLERKHQAAVGRNDDFQPEWRLPAAIAGGPVVTSGLFIFAWTIYPWVHWIAPIIGSALFGAGTIFVYSGIFTFLVDAYPTYAASALAANSFTRSTFGAVFPLFGIQMYNGLGYHWATSLLGFLTLFMSPFPYIFFRYGSRIRQKSRFAMSGF